MTKKKQELGEIGKYMELVSRLGITMVGTILLFLFFGLALDRFFHTNGIMVVIGIVFGVLAGFYLFYKAIKDVF